MPVGMHRGGGGGGGGGGGMRHNGGGFHRRSRTVILGGNLLGSNLWPVYTQPRYSDELLQALIDYYYAKLLAEKNAMPAPTPPAAPAATDTAIRDAYIAWQHALATSNDMAYVNSFKQRLDMLVYGT